MLATDRELDIGDEPTVFEFVERNRPTAILNCAAYTAVDAAETDEATATRVNGVGPRNLARAAVFAQAHLVHVSTDYVFPGDGTVPYVETDPIGPRNAYGRSKLAGDLAIAEAFERSQERGSSRWIVFRTSWLFGDGGSSFVETMWRLMGDKAELKVVNDQVGRPTYVEDLAAVMILASGIGQVAAPPSGVWHFANAGQTSWHGFATAIRESMLRAGVAVRTERVLPVSSEEFPRPAPRPRYSVLDTKKLESWGVQPRPWREALDEYIDARALRL